MKTWRGMSLGLLLAGGVLAQGAWAGEWIADAKGCKLWNPNRKVGVTVSWDGVCTDGYANGRGVYQWFVDGELVKRDVGEYKNGRLQNKDENAELKIIEIEVQSAYRSAFKNATTVSELNGFIQKYKDNDPDGLVPQARKKIPAAQKYEQEQERLAAIKRAKEEREAYRTAFKNASSSSDLSAFVERYKNNDPEKLVPKARQKISAAQKRERDQSAKQEREYAARLAQECGRLYPGKLVSWTARMCEGRALGLFGGGCYDEKFEGIIVGGGKGIATAKITKPSHKNGEYSERSCSDFN